MAENSNGQVAKDENGAYHFTTEQILFINEYSQTTKKNAEGKRIDKDGNPTTDPSEYQYLSNLESLPEDISKIDDGSTSGTKVNTTISVSQRSYRPDDESIEASRVGSIFQASQRCRKIVTHQSHDKHHNPNFILFNDISTH